jgi:hypothetical protein
MDESLVAREFESNSLHHSVFLVQRISENRQPVYPAASVRDFLSGAYISPSLGLRSSLQSADRSAYRLIVLEWNDISARAIYVKRLIVESNNGENHLEFSIDNDGRPEVALPADNVSVRCCRGLGGLRFEFLLHPPDDLPFQFIAVAFQPSDATVTETQPKIRWSPPHVLIFDSRDTEIARFPSN